MPRGGRGGLHHSTRKPVDLTRVVSVAERNDLVTLVTAITDKVYQDVCTAFDSPPVSPINSDAVSAVHHHHWLSRPLNHHQNDQNIPPSNIIPNAKGDGSKSFIKAHEIVEKEERASMTPQLRELKKEASNTLRKWQSLIIVRLRDMVVNDMDVTAIGGSQGRGRGRGGFRGGTRGRGGRGNLAAGSRTLLNTATLATGPPRLPTNPADLGLAHRYPPIPNTLWPLLPEKRRILLNIVLLMLLSHQEYNAYSRILLHYLTSSLNLPLRVFQEAEVRVATALASVAIETPPRETTEQPPDEALDPEQPKIADSSKGADQPKTARRWKYGLGGPGTPGALAEPLANAGIGWIQEGRSIPAGIAAGLLGSLADSGYVVGSLFGMNATRPASKSLGAYAREVPDFGLLSIHDEPPMNYPDSGNIAPETRRLRLVIAISGWIMEGKDVVEPWKVMSTRPESYALRWELGSLFSLGTALQTVIKSTAWGRAKKQIMTQSLRLSLHNSSWPEPLLKMSKIIDNPWSVGMVRAEKAGVTLADAIMRSKFQGDRPVSLVGFSLAARAIYTCLMVLAERRCFGLVESVVMMGLPAPSESRVWLTLKSVIAGRLINVYSENDYILGFLCRTSNIQFGIAGLEEVQGAEGVENYNASCYVRLDGKMSTPGHKPLFVQPRLLVEKPDVECWSDEYYRHRISPIFAQPVSVPT